MANDAKLTAVLEAKDNMTATIVKSKKNLADFGKQAKTTANDVTSATDKISSGLDKVVADTQKTKNALGGIKGNYDVAISIKDLASSPLKAIKSGLSSIVGKTYTTSIKAKDNASNTISKLKSELSGLAGKTYTAIVNVKSNMNKNGINISEKAGNFADGLLMPMGIQMAGMAGAGLGVMDTVKTYTDFTAQMSTVRAISGASAEDMKLLTNKAKEMGSTTQFSASEAGKALEYMAMAGWKTQDMLNGISSVMNLAGASGEDLATVSDIVTDALTAFNLTVADSGRFADILAAASSNSNTNVKMMGETFKYVAPVAGALGYNVEDVGGGVGLMANAGIKASEAGTALRAILSRLIAPPKDAATAMDTLGLKVKNADGSIKPFSQTLKDLREKMSGLSKADKTELANKLAGQEAMSALLAMVNATEADFDKLTEAIKKSEGEAEKMNKIRNDNLRGDLKQLASIWEGIQLDIMGDGEGAGGAAGETLRGTIKALNVELNKFHENIRNGINMNAIFEVGIDGVKALIGKFIEFDGIGSVLAGGALALGLAKIYKLVTKVSSGINKTIEMAKNLPNNLPGTTPNNLPTSTPPVGQTVKDIVLNAQNVYVNGQNPVGEDLPTPEGLPETQNNKEPSNKPEPTTKRSRWEGVKDVLKTGASYGSNMWKTSLLFEIPTAAYDIYNAEDGEKGAAVAKAGGSIAGGWAGAKIGGATGAAIGSIVPGIGNAAGGIIGAIIGEISGSIFGGDVAEKGARLFDFSADENILTYIKNSSWGQATAKANQTNMNLTQMQAQGTTDIFGTIADEQGNFRIQSMETQIEGQQQLFTNLKNFASDTWNSITDTVNETGQIQMQNTQMQVEGQQEMYNSLKDFASDTWNSITNTASEAGNIQVQNAQMQAQANMETWNSIKDAANEACESVKSKWAEAVSWIDSTVYSPLKSAAESAGTGIASGINSAIDTIKGAWSGLGNWFESNVFAPIRQKYLDLKNSAPAPVQSALNYVDGGIGHNATGTMNWVGGLTEINETGGEIVDLPSGSRIYPAQTTERIIKNELNDNSINTTGGNVTITGNTFVVRSETDIDEIAHRLFQLMYQANTNYGGVY